MNQRPRAYETCDYVQLLNKIFGSTNKSKFISLSKLSRSYLSQVRNGHRPPSPALKQEVYDFLVSYRTERDYYNLFLNSRDAMGVTEQTMDFYRKKLGRFLFEVNADYATRQDIEEFLQQFPNLGNRHAYYRVIKTFYNWRDETFDIPTPVKKLKAPRQEKLILPSLTAGQVEALLDKAESIRDKAIIAMFVESGLRLSELEALRLCDIDWDMGTVKVYGKGRKEALAPFGARTGAFLKTWLKENQNSNGNIWGMNKWGIISMLRRLEKATGLPSNPHTFRRTFACLLRKADLDVLTIKDLGRWESVEMVQRYTRSVDFQDNLKFYRGIIPDK